MADKLVAFGTEYDNVAGIKGTDDNSQTLTFIRPQGTKSISANGIGIDVAAYAEVDVAVPFPSPTLQTKSKSYTPSETAQTEAVTADNGYDGLDTVNVSVAAISSTYVGSGITRRSSSDLTASGATVTAPSGYYENSASKAIATGAVALPSALASSGGATVTSSGTEITLTKQMSIQASVTTAGYVSSIPSSTADVTLRATDNNFLDSNIKSGVTIFGKTGTYSGGTSKNTQVVHGTKRVASTAYTDVGYEITVAKTGTYNAYWAGWRSSTSGTNGAQLYVNDVASGNAVTTFDSSWTNVQNGSRTSVSLTQGDKVTLRARSRGTSYYMYIFFLSIEEV